MHACICIYIYINDEYWLSMLIKAHRTSICIEFVHDDVIKWKHFPRYWPFVQGIQRSPVNSPHKGQWRGALMFSLICAWINAPANNREAGDLRRHRAHYDVIVMQSGNFRLQMVWVNSLWRSHVSTYIWVSIGSGIWLGIWWQQVITWANVDYSLVLFSGFIRGQFHS